MKIRKGHVTGFLATVIVFGAIFVYIYLGTMETGWLYNLKDKTKESLGKNISQVIIDNNEEYVAYTTIKGNLKLCSLKNIKDVIFSEKEINKVFFVKNLLVIIDKDGNVSSYNIKNKEKNNYNIDCYNKYVCVSGDKLYTVEPGIISEIDLFKNDSYKENKLNFSYTNPSDISNTNEFIGLFREKKLDIFFFPDFRKITIDLEYYSSNGKFYIDDNNKIVAYFNIDGQTVLNNNGKEKILTEVINPHSISITKNNILIASKKEMAAYDIKGRLLWQKDIMCDVMSVNNKGDKFISVYSKAQASVYNLKSGEEELTLDTLKKANYSPKDNYIVGYQKSAY